MRLTTLENKDFSMDKKEAAYKQLIADLIGREHHTTYERMKDLDFARLNNFDTLYSYRMLDFDEQQLLAQEVKQEYMSGKFDPEMALKYERTAREMLRRCMLIL